ncbi:phenylalanine--tRNA ligase subunit beta [Acidaminobacterium chupaoyuni]
MNLPYKWLNDYVKIDKDIKEYAARMTMTGSKVEGWENPADEISNVVWAKVLQIEPHPDADKLVICQMDVGDKTVQILTGAKNLKVGDVVPACLHNARLPGGVVIKKTKMRGVESNGMLCSFAELGLTHNDCPYADPNGILVYQNEDCEAVLGEPVTKALGIDDAIIEFEITPNRPDCLSVIGLARETAASFELPMTLPQVPARDAAGEIHDLLNVTIADADLCPRYCAAMAKNIKIAPSPKWMRERLREAGIRPINNIVDITNFVMLEYGQPMHAFDYRCIEENSIVVRRAASGETITTLDGQQRPLSEGMLLITDPKKPIGVAGVMGGGNSEITENTQMIVFESATFSGPSIRVTSRKLGLRTEASGRYEKGLDCENTMPALMRACQLVELLGAGEIVSGVIDTYPVKKVTRTLPLEPEKICRFLGAEISESDMIRSLTDLQFPVENRLITVPSWRDDVEGMADIAEEIARIYGYDKIKPTLFSGATTAGGLSPEQHFERRLSDACLATGFNEMISLSFMSPKVFDKLLIPAESPLRIATVISNPLGEDQSLMRTTPLPGLLETNARNYNFRLPAARFFELSKIYLPKKTAEGTADLTVLPDEKKILTMSLYGDGDFYSLKGALEAIFHILSLRDLVFVPCTTNPTYHPGRTAAIMAGDVEIGVAGQIHPLVLRNYGIGAEVYACEIDLNALYAQMDHNKVYKALPKFPAVTRDVALLCEEALPVLKLEQSIRAATGKSLENLTLFDVYKGAQVGEGKKSVAYSLALRSYDHTLTDEEADAVMKKVLARLETECGAVIRS